MRVSSMPIVGKIPRPESGWIRISDRQVRLPAWPRVLLRTRLQFPPHSIFTVRTPSVHLFPRVSRSRGGGKRECCLLHEFHEFSWWRGARVVLPPLPVARPTLDYALVTSKSRRERPNWNETRENWGGNWESIWESNSREDIFFQMDVKVVSFNRLFWECAQFLRCSIRYKCIGQFFEQSPGF